MCRIKFPDVVQQSSSGKASRLIQAYHKYTLPALDERDALTAVTLTNHQSVVVCAKQKGQQSEVYVPAVLEERLADWRLKRAAGKSDVEIREELAPNNLIATSRDMLSAYNEEVRATSDIAAAFNAGLLKRWAAKQLTVSQGRCLRKPFVPLARGVPCRMWAHNFCNIWGFGDPAVGTSGSGPHKPHYHVGFCHVQKEETAGTGGTPYHN